MQNEELMIHVDDFEEITMEEIALREEEQGDVILCQCVF